MRVFDNKLNGCRFELRLKSAMQARNLKLGGCQFRLLLSEETNNNNLCNVQGLGK